MKKRIVMFCCSLSFFCNAATASKPINKLEEASHFIGSGENKVSFDLGKIVLIFSEKPIVNLVPGEKKGSLEVKTFLFPLSMVSTQKAKKMVNSLNNSNSRHYKFYLEQVQTPIKGLKLTVSYNPMNVSLEEPRYFNTVRSSKAVEFRFHNRALVNEIKKRLNNPSQLAATKKKGLLLLTAVTGVKIPGLSVMA